MNAPTLVRPQCQPGTEPVYATGHKHTEDGTCLRSVLTVGGWLHGLNAFEADAVLNLGKRCPAMRRLDQDRVEMCTRKPHQDGEHVDGTALQLLRLGYADGSTYRPVPPTVGPWFVPRMTRKR